MKKFLVILTALILTMLMLLMPAMAETAEATAVPESAAEEVAETMEEEEESWLSEAFGSLLGMKWYTAVILIALAVMGVVICRQKSGGWTARRLAYAGMCIAVAFVLSCIKLFRMPQGGSVTPAAMLPLILFALAFGPGQGLVVGCAFGLLQLIEDFYVIHPIQLLVDYPMAYAALALGCIALLLPEKYDRFRLPMAVLLGYFGRYMMASVSGAVFFAEYAGEQNAWVYSLGYNFSYLGVEAAIACMLSFLPGFGRILKLMRSGR